MGQSGMWLLSLIAITVVGTVTALGIGAAHAADGSEQSPAFDEGTVLRSSFLISRGIDTDGEIEEVTADYWLRVGQMTKRTFKERFWQIAKEKSSRKASVIVPMASAPLICQRQARSSRLPALSICLRLCGRRSRSTGSCWTKASNCLANQRWLVCLLWSTRSGKP